MSNDAEGPREPISAADRVTGSQNDSPVEPADAAGSGRIVATPAVIAKQGAGPSPDGPNGPDGPGGPGGQPTDGTGDGPGAEDRQSDRPDAAPESGGAVILPFPMDRVRRPGTPRARSDAAMLAPTPEARMADPAPTDLSQIEPRSAEDWRLAAAIMADAEAQAVRNANLARESQARMREAAAAFQRTQATAAEVRRTLAGQNVQGLRDSAAKLRETVAWMDRVLGDLDR